ncbi:sensor histidine kinase [Brucella sp. H1_1004]|uniref:sensor histidine kinase n=1 Tax=Brucella sp. H1_1004 TaxID=3110109 RepID=UPI0039B4371B
MKNTFAVVQVIVAQTLRLSESVETAKEIINSRLQALASAQDILTSTEFTEADVGEIVKAALGAHQSPDARVEIVGERYSLNPQQALGLSLSIHELATNAVKYGALSNQSGKVVISWYLTGGQFEFQWVESGGPAVRIPTRQSFGSLLIKRVAASYFGGESLLDFKPEGLVYKLSVSKPAA